jgi:YbbR domain-containing protein
VKKINILIMVLSFVLAAILWGYVVFFINPPSDKTVDSIPVVFINESALTGRNLILTEGMDTTVSVRFYGSMQDIARLNRSTVQAVVDLRHINRNNVGIVPMSYELQGPAELDSVEIVSITPLVHITVDTLISKSVSIRLDLRGGTAENYNHDDPVFEPFQLNIAGPSKVLDTVHVAEVVYEPIDLISRSLIDLPLGYTLYTASGEIVESEFITADYDEVWLTLNVYREKTVPLVIRFIEGGGLNGSNLVWSVEPESVRVAGDPEDLDLLNEIVVREVNLAELRGNHSDKYVIHYPLNVRNLSHFDEAQVTIEIVGAVTRDIETMNVQINPPVIPEGYTFAIVNRPITVTLRGPNGDVLRVEPNNVRITANFSEEEVHVGGRYQRSGKDVQVFIDGFPTVGAIDLGYEVTIEIVPDEGAP